MLIRYLFLLLLLLLPPPHDRHCHRVFLLPVSPQVIHCPVMDLRHKSLPLRQQHQQRGPPPLGFSSLMATRRTTNTLLMCDKSHCIVPNTRLSSPSTVVSAAVVKKMKCLWILSSVFFLLLWTFRDLSVTTATTNKKVLLLCSYLLNEVMWANGWQK